MSMNPSSTILLSLVLIQFLVGSHSVTFTIVNNCNHTVWPALLSVAGIPDLASTGFVLHPGDSNALFIHPGWSGRIWGRTLCLQQATGNFSCVTGDCGTSTLECSGSRADAPVTLAEFVLDDAGGLDYYDISVGDGYNLPMKIVPQGGTGAGTCSVIACVIDLNSACPSELKVLSSSNSVACKRACEAFPDPHHCNPNSYSELFFKTACPLASSYAFDGRTNTFTCASADYIVSFCSTASTSVKPVDGKKPVRGVKGVDISAAIVDYSARCFAMMILILAASLWLWQIV